MCTGANKYWNLFIHIKWFDAKARAHWQRLHSPLALTRCRFFSQMNIRIRSPDYTIFCGAIVSNVIEIRDELTNECVRKTRTHTNLHQTNLWYRSMAEIGINQIERTEKRQRTCSAPQLIWMSGLEHDTNIPRHPHLHISHVVFLSPRETDKTASKINAVFVYEKTRGKLTRILTTSHWQRLSLFPLNVSHHLHIPACLAGWLADLLTGRALEEYEWREEKIVSRVVGTVRPKWRNKKWLNHRFERGKTTRTMFAY